MKWVFAVLVVLFLIFFFKPPDVIARVSELEPPSSSSV